MNQQFKSASRIGLAALLLNLAGASHAALTWHWVNQPTDPNLLSASTTAMNGAVADFNAFSNYNGDIALNYNSGVPTAQTDGWMNGNWIEFGGSYSQRTFEHEISHWLVNGTYSGWWNLNGTGTWAGAGAQALDQIFDGPSAVLHCDSIHYWGYGANYDNEPFGFRHIAMVGALRGDCGLSDTTKWTVPSGNYTLRFNSSNTYLDSLGNSVSGSTLVLEPSSTGTSQQWTFTSAGGHYFYIKNVSTGLYLDDLGNTTYGHTVGQKTYSGASSQQWAVTPGVIAPASPMYYNIVSKDSNCVLDNNGSSAAGAPALIWDWWWGANTNQQVQLMGASSAASAALNPPTIANGNHTLSPVYAPGMCLDASNSGTTNGTAVDLWQATGAANQKWKFTSLGNNVYTIKPSYINSLALTVTGTSNGSTVNLTTIGSKPSSNQKWTAIWDGGNQWEFVPASASNLVIDCNGWGTSNGTVVQGWTALSGTNQTFIVN